MAEVKTSSIINANQNSCSSPSSNIASTVSMKDTRSSRRLDKSELLCPFCNGKLVFHGVTRNQSYNFAGKRLSSPQPYSVELVVFVCHQCGFIEKFNRELFDSTSFVKNAGE